MTSEMYQQPKPAYWPAYNAGSSDFADFSTYPGASSYNPDEYRREPSRPARTPQGWERGSKYDSALEQDDASRPSVRQTPGRDRRQPSENTGELSGYTDSADPLAKPRQDILSGLNELLTQEGPVRTMFEKVNDTYPNLTRDFQQAHGDPIKLTSVISKAAANTPQGQQALAWFKKIPWPGRKIIQHYTVNRLPKEYRDITQNFLDAPALSNIDSGASSGHNARSKQSRKPPMQEDDWAQDFTS